MVCPSGFTQPGSLIPGSTDCYLCCQPGNNGYCEFVGDCGGTEPKARPDFVNAGQINTTVTGNSFVDLAYSVPFIASDADAYITSLLSKQIIIGFEPTFFQVPYIYSYADNLINGKYTSVILKDDSLEQIISYKIPYKEEFKEEIVNIVTYYNKETKILFHEIPREFSYNSIDQASIAYIQLADGSFNGTLKIPSSFVSNIDNRNYKLTFSISSTDLITVNDAIPLVQCSTKVNTTEYNECLNIKGLLGQSYIRVLG